MFHNRKYTELPQWRALFRIRNRGLQTMSEESKVAPVGGSKDVEMAVVSIHDKVNGVKRALSNLVGKMGSDQQLSWPSVLDSFSSLSGHASTLMKQLSNDKMPPLHTRVVLPLQVTNDRDFELEKQTEGRVPILHHEIVPHYMRTKLDLELEAKQREAKEESIKKSSILKDKIKKFNEMLSGSLDRVNELQGELEEQRTRAEVTQSTTAETKRLVQMYLHGVGLTSLSMNRKTLLAGGRLMASTQQGAVPGKAPSALRNELRQAVNTATAPYQTSPHKR